MNAKIGRPHLYKPKENCMTFRCTNLIYSRGLCSSCYHSNYREHGKANQILSFINTRDRFKMPKFHPSTNLCLFGECVATAVDGRGACYEHRESNPVEKYVQYVSKTRREAKEIL